LPRSRWTTGRQKRVVCMIRHSKCVPVSPCVLQQKPRKKRVYAEHPWSRRPSSRRFGHLFSLPRRLDRKDWTSIPTALGLCIGTSRGTLLISSNVKDGSIVTKTMLFDAMSSLLFRPLLSLPRAGNHHGSPCLRQRKLM